MTVKPIPEGYHSVTPYLIIKGAADAIEFYKKAFGATELFRFPAPDGKIGHAEIKIGDSPIMLADEFAEMGYKGPQALGGSPVSLMIYLDDVDAVFNRAVEAGASIKEGRQDKFFCDRNCTLTGPFCLVWPVGRHHGESTMGKREKRAQQASAKASGGGQ